MKTTPKAAGKKAAQAKKDTKPAGPGAIAAGGGLGVVDATPDDGAPKEVEAFSATGIDNALDLLEVVNAKMDKASIGSKAADIERHPEVSLGLHRTRAGLLMYMHRDDSRLRLKHTRSGSSRKPAKRYVFHYLVLPYWVLTRLLRCSQHPGLRLQQYHVGPMT